jgi:hypothetical protein
MDSALLNSAIGPEFSSKKVKRFLSSRMIDFKELDDSRLISFLDEKIDSDSIIGLCRGNFSIFTGHPSDPVVISSTNAAAMEELCRFRDVNFAYKALLGVMVLESDLNEVFELSPAISEYISRGESTASIAANLKNGFITENNLDNMKDHKFNLIVIPEPEADNAADVTGKNENQKILDKSGDSLRCSGENLLYKLLILRKKKEKNPVLLTCPLYFDGERSFDTAQFISDFKESKLAALAIENYVIEK